MIISTRFIPKFNTLHQSLVYTYIVCERLSVMQELVWVRRVPHFGKSMNTLPSPAHIENCQGIWFWACQGYPPPKLSGTLDLSSPRIAPPPFPNENCERWLIYATGACEVIAVSPRIPSRFICWFTCSLTHSVRQWVTVSLGLQIHLSVTYVH